MNPLLQYLFQLRRAGQQRVSGQTGLVRNPAPQISSSQAGLVDALSQYNGMSRGQTLQLMTPISRMILQGYPNKLQQINTVMAQPAQRLAMSSAGITGRQAPVGNIPVGTTRQPVPAQPTMTTSTDTPYVQTMNQLRQPRPEKVGLRWTTPLQQTNILGNTPVSGRNSVMPSIGAIPDNSILGNTTIPIGAVRI